VLLGGVDLSKYCLSVSMRSVPQAPNGDHSGWACVDRSSGTVRATFTPDQACVFEYRQTAAHAVVGSLKDPSTWRCYR
jgi:hypothetical protein